MTLYDELLAADLPIDNHESDLYVLDCPKAREILKRHPTQQSNATSFVSNVDGKRWIDVPFAFDPWWLLRAGWRREEREDAHFRCC